MMMTTCVECRVKIGELLEGRMDNTPIILCPRCYSILRKCAERLFELEKGEKILKEKQDAIPNS